MVTPLYAALLTALLVALTVRTIRMRFRHKTGLGDGGHEDLQCTIRAHGNFIEYAPMGLLLIYLLEQAGWGGWIAHGLGLLLVAGRGLHAYGLSLNAGPTPFRLYGMVLTLAQLSLSALLCLWVFLLTNM